MSSHTDDFFGWAEFSSYKSHSKSQKSLHQNFLRNFLAEKFCSEASQRSKKVLLVNILEKRCTYVLRPPASVIML